MYDTKGPNVPTGSRAYATEAYENQPVPNACEEVYAAFSEARDLAFAVKEVVNRLIGAAPEPVGGKQALGEKGAIFPSLREASSHTVEVLRSAQAALTRLQREIN